MTKRSAFFAMVQGYFGSQDRAQVALDLLLFRVLGRLALFNSTRLFTGQFSHQLFSLAYVEFVADDGLKSGQLGFFGVQAEQRAPVAFADLSRC